MSTSELVEATTTAIAEFNDFDAQLAEFRGRYEGVVYDLDDPKQDKQARSDKLAIGKVVAKLDARHKAIKGPLLDATRVVDGRRKEIKDGLLEVQSGIKSQIEAREQKEQDRKNAILARINAIVDLAEETDTNAGSVMLAVRLQEAKDVVLDDSWEEFKAAAALAQTEAVQKLTTFLSSRTTWETEQTELARLREEAEARERADREEKIRADAEAKAKDDAEEAIAAEKRRAEESEKARLAAEAKAKDDADRAAEQAAAAERQRIADEQAERERKESAERALEEKRQANQKHRKAIHGKAKQSLMAATGLDEKVAIVVVEAIRDGKVENVVVNY